MTAGASPVPQVRTVRERMARVARACRREAPGRTCQHRLLQHEQPSAVGLGRVVVEEAVQKHDQARVVPAKRESGRSECAAARRSRHALGRARLRLAMTA